MKLPLLCPATLKELRQNGHELSGPGGIVYPMVADIPWLFPDPKPTLAAWRERASLSIQHLDAEIETLKSKIKGSSIESTKARLTSTRLLKIRHLEMLRRTLEPLKPFTKLNLTQKKSYGYRLPLRQGLLGYFPNLIRDWSGLYESENEIQFACALELAKKTKPILETSELKILVLGAGGSRLAYDLAKKFPKSQVVAFDLNPILLLAAKQICDGEKISASEVSVSPKDSASPGRAVELSRPLGPAPNLGFVFGDIYALPFQPASFDLCVSPWLVDIVPRKFADLCASVAHAVKPGGLWLNTGSWHFDFRDDSENLSLPEAAEQAQEFGWSPREANQVEVPYLQSVFDAHRRFETITQFCWERNTDAVTVAPSIDDRAEWIRDVDRPVPPLEMFGSGAETHAVMALILSLVDGQRTLGEIAQIVASENEMPIEQALDAVQTFFDRFNKDRLFREMS